MKYILLFNCKNDENDKKWLQEIFVNRGLETIVIEPKKTIHKLLFMQGIKGKVQFFYAIFDQAFRAIWQSTPNDIIIVWSTMVGWFLNLFNLLTGNRRRLILMNWLTPKPTRSYWKFLQKIAANNSKCRIIVNSTSSCAQWLVYLGIKDKQNFSFLPDIYDNTIQFKKPIIRKNKYVFTGGFTNRDWSMLMSIAEELPEIKFICVGLEKVMMKEISNIPRNVEIYYQLNADKYYKLMHGATIVALPLKNDWVSGLINITHAAQNGQICCCTHYDFVDIYFPSQCKKNLLPNEKWAWINRIKQIYELNKEQYLAEAEIFQKHIKNEFAPERAFEVLFNCWK